MREINSIQGQSGAAMVHSNIGYLAREEFLKTWPVMAGKSLDEIYAFGRESGQSGFPAHSGIETCDPCAPLTPDRLIASIKPDSLMPSRMATLVSQNHSAQNAPNIAACTSSEMNPSCPIVISSSVDLAVEPTASQSVELPALGAAVGRAAAGVPEFHTPPSNTGVNESQQVARGSV